jgi:hypothetical protein
MCGALCEALVIVRDLKHHLLGYFVLHIIGNTARFVGALRSGEILNHGAVMVTV